MGNSRNFKYLDELIHSGAKEIVLDSDIILDDCEEDEYLEGIRLDVNSMTINGKGHTIDARGKAGMFECTGRNVVLCNLNLKNGFSNGSKAIITNDGGELLVAKSEISQSHGNLSNVVSNEGGRLNITDSILSDNDAVSGEVIINKGDMSIHDSAISHNRAVRSKGVIGNWGNLRISDSTVNRNESERDGIICNEGILTVSGSEFCDNFSHFDGGAICNRDILVISDSKFHKNRTQFYGGAICTHNGNLHIRNSIFEDNGARNGGAIFNYKIHDIDLKECTFKGNKPDDIFKR